MVRLERVFTQEGVSYFTVVPLSWHLETNPSADEIAVWMYGNVTLLQALSTIETMQPEKEGDMGSGSGKMLERLEFKVDLALSLLSKLLAQNTDLPASYRAFLSAEGMEWISKEAAEQGDEIVISAYISPKLPQPLILPARIEAVRREETGTRIHATFTHLNEETQDWLSRTVFRYHRRAIQNLHHD